LDLILTGRAVTAQEAYEIGLVNRLVPSGQARQAAESLAQDLARFPQTCLRSDRMSVLEQWNLDETAALSNEFDHGNASLADAQSGAERFKSGHGRHGSFDNDT
jgi:enoyl-CoA hydratase